MVAWEKIFFSFSNLKDKKQTKALLTLQNVDNLHLKQIWRKHLPPLRNFVMPLFFSKLTNIWVIFRSFLQVSTVSFSLNFFSDWSRCEATLDFPSQFLLPVSVPITDWSLSILCFHYLFHLGRGRRQGKNLIPKSMIILLRY